MSQYGGEELNGTESAAAGSMIYRRPSARHTRDSPFVGSAKLYYKSKSRGSCRGRRYEQLTLSWPLARSRWYPLLAVPAEREREREHLFAMDQPRTCCLRDAETNKWSYDYHLCLDLLNMAAAGSIGCHELAGRRIALGRP